MGWALLCNDRSRAERGRYRATDRPAIFAATCQMQAAASHSGYYLSTISNASEVPGGASTLRYRSLKFERLPFRYGNKGYASSRSTRL